MLDSLIWVPHHVSALIASLVGFMALCGPEPQPDKGPEPGGRARRTLFAGVCFASAFGLSVWVTVGAVATAAAWGVSLLARRRFALALALLAAGAVALAMAAPQLLDLHAGRAPGPFPVVATVRAFSPVENAMGPGPLRLLARLVCLPLNDFAEFGLLASGALLYWRGQERLKGAPEFARVLALAAGCGLFVGTFFKSTLYNNDLGWRVMLFPLLAAIAWTVAALEARLASTGAASAPAAWRRLPATVWLLGGIGLATTLYTLAAERLYDRMPLGAGYAFFATDPRTERDLRAAYAWADAHLPPDEVLQHDPAPPRVFPFGLYGRNRVAVADGAAGLYGASQAAVDARVAALAPIFTGALDSAAAKARAGASGVQALVVDDADPAWRRPGSWVWTSPSIYAAARARIVPVASLGALR